MNKYFGLLLVYFLGDVLKTTRTIGEHVYSVPNVMYFESNELLYFQVIKPAKVGYIYKARLAQDFGCSFKHIYEHINLVPVDPPDGCEPLRNKALVNGAIGLAERGGCSFLAKAKNAENAGALGILIADNNIENDRVVVRMVADGTKRTINIPAAFMLAQDSKHIRDALKDEGMYGALINIPVNVTSSPDLFRRQPPWSYW